jgi:hypothetical protein
MTNGIEFAAISWLIALATKTIAIYNVCNHLWKSATKQVEDILNKCLAYIGLA